MSHLKFLGDDGIGPMERSKVNSILNINDPMPRNECQRAYRNQRTPMETSYIKADAELQYLIAERSSPSVGLNLKYTTHIKGHYGIEDPESKFSKKGM